MEIVNNKIELPIVDFGGKEVGKTELAPEIFGVEPMTIRFSLLSRLT